MRRIAQVSHLTFFQWGPIHSLQSNQNSNTTCYKTLFNESGSVSFIRSCKREDRHYFNLILKLPSKSICFKYNEIREAIPASGSSESETMRARLKAEGTVSVKTKELII